MNSMKNYDNSYKCRLKERIADIFIQVTESACSKCLFLGFFETEIPFDILKDEYKKLD